MSTDMTTGHDEGTDAEAHGAEGHGSVAMYVWIGVILAIVTFVEVAIYYIEAFGAIEVPLLILLSASKVVLVIMYFMHLKMDHRALTGLFMAGVVLTLFMVSSLVVLYHVLPNLALSP